MGCLFVTVFFIGSLQFMQNVLYKDKFNIPKRKNKFIFLM